jgi:hypothetical protein
VIYVFVHQFKTVMLCLWSGLDLLHHLSLINRLPLLTKYLICIKYTLTSYKFASQIYRDSTGLLRFAFDNLDDRQ